MHDKCPQSAQSIKVEVEMLKFQPLQTVSQLEELYCFLFFFLIINLYFCKKIFFLPIESHQRLIFCSLSI